MMIALRRTMLFLAMSVSIDVGAALISLQSELSQLAQPAPRSGPRFAVGSYIIGQQCRVAQGCFEAPHPMRSDEEGFIIIYDILQNNEDISPCVALQSKTTIQPFNSWFGSYIFINNQRVWKDGIDFKSFCEMVKKTIKNSGDKGLTYLENNEHALVIIARREDEWYTYCMGNVVKITQPLNSAKKSIITVTSRNSEAQSFDQPDNESIVFVTGSFTQNNLPALIDQHVRKSYTSQPFEHLNDQQADELARDIALSIARAYYPPVTDIAFKGSATVLRFFTTKPQ